MKAIILAAGYGTRLKPLTDDLPKPMIKINGRPVLEHIANNLNYFGIYDIVVNTHYLPEKIMKYFGTRFLYSYEPKLLGEKGTIESLKYWLADDWCVVCNGDTLSNVNVLDMMRISDGMNIKYMDNGVYAGTRILEPGYLLGDRKSASFESKDCFWIDIGTFKGLERAVKEYEEISKMS